MVYHFLVAYNILYIFYSVMHPITHYTALHTLVMSLQNSKNITRAGYETQLHAILNLPFYIGSLHYFIQ